MATFASAWWTWVTEITCTLLRVTTLPQGPRRPVSGQGQLLCVGALASLCPRSLPGHSKMAEPDVDLRRTAPAALATARTTPTTCFARATQPASFPNATQPIALSSAVAAAISSPVAAFPTTSGGHCLTAAPSSNVSFLLPYSTCMLPPVSTCRVS